MDVSAQAARMLATLSSPSQQQRLIELSVPGDGPGEDLVAERVHGFEAVCGGFGFSIDALSPSARLDLMPLLGRPLALGLRTASGAWRRWHGLCTAVSSLGADGGLARYRLVMAPWTALLQHRRNALVFQDLDLRGVLEQVFADYPEADYRFELTAPLPVRAITTQYRESDAAFVARLLAEAGLAWRFDHGGDGDDGRHTLVVFDPIAEVPDGGRVRFHRSDATEADDAIIAFSQRRQVTAQAAQVASWQTGQLTSLAGQAGTDAGTLPPLEVFVQPHAGRFAQASDGQQAAERLLDALRLPQALYAGSGSLRTLAAGHALTLTGHPDGDTIFVPLHIAHVAVNNLGHGIAELLDAPVLERGSYRNRFVAAPADAPLVPVPPLRPTAAGPQTAIVVGLPEAAVTPSRDHQVRIQFPWQRGSVPHTGGLTDTGSDHPGHAPGDQTSGTWVPVAEPVAGPNWGAHLLPRIGAEVLVEFLHGDIDQPVITGQLYNGQVAPPFGGSHDQPQPGVLSGLHSQGHDGSGSQQWLIDDTPGQLRTRLHTSLGESRLELGYLVQHAQTRRGPLRGQGFALASDGWGNVHAASGLLLSATARPQATSTQLDSAEAVAQLKGAERTAQALHDTLGQQQVPGLSANPQLTALREAIDPQANGAYAGSVNGQSAMKPASGSRDPGDAPVERFADPRLLAESPEAIAFATAQSAVAYAGGALHLTVQDDAHLAAGHTFAAVAGQHAALYAHAGPIKAIAANGDLTVQAHTDAMEVLADQSVTVTATDHRIDVLAKDKIVLQAGQCRITLEGGNITFEGDEFVVRASQHPFLGGESGDVRLSLPDGIVKLEPDRMLDFSG